MSDLSASPPGNPTEHPDPEETARALLDAATPGPWGARWSNPTTEPTAFAEAIKLSIEHDREKATSSTSWRVITEPDGDEWLNLAFIGNGLTSEANAALIAAAPTLIADLLARVESQAAEITCLRERTTPPAQFVANGWDVQQIIDSLDGDTIHTRSAPVAAQLIRHAYLEAP